MQRKHIRFPLISRKFYILVRQQCLQCYPCTWISFLLERILKYFQGQCKLGPSTSLHPFSLDLLHVYIISGMSFLTFLNSDIFVCFCFLFHYIMIFKSFHVMIHFVPNSSFSILYAHSAIWNSLIKTNNIVISSI